MGVRDDVSFEGIGQEPVSFRHDGSIVFDATKEGGSAVVKRVVSMKSDRTVGLSVDGEKVLGQLFKVEDDSHCGVITEGFIDPPAGVGADLTLDRGIVGALGGVGGVEAGFIRSAAPATLADVANARGQIVNAAVTTAVVVDLG